MSQVEALLAPPSGHSQATLREGRAQAPRTGDTARRGKGQGARCLLVAICSSVLGAASPVGRDPSKRCARPEAVQLVPALKGLGPWGHRPPRCGAPGGVRALRAGPGAPCPPAPASPAGGLAGRGVVAVSCVFRPTCPALFAAACDLGSAGHPSAPPARGQRLVVWRAPTRPAGGGRAQAPRCGEHTQSWARACGASAPPSRPGDDAHGCEQRAPLSGRLTRAGLGLRRPSRDLA